MERIRDRIVGLDMSEIDQTLMEFAAFVAKSGFVQKVQFWHIVRIEKIPSDIQREFPDMLDRLVSERTEKIQELVTQHFRVENVEIEYHIEKGSVATLLSIAIKGSADLIIIGRKKNLHCSGVLAQRLARRATCNLLIVPEGSAPNLRKLLVPVDFSKYSRLALETAVELSQQRKEHIEVYCQNVYRVPAGYHYTGKTHEEFAEIMRRNAEKDFNKLIKKIDTKGVSVTPVYSEDVNEDLSSDISDLAEEIHPDGIVIGAKGRTATASLFLGSIAEKLINKKLEYPLLIVRPRGVSAGILETLRDID
ncbi:MAG: universal stress protein [Cyclobacteriaceae bacterium]